MNLTLLFYSENIKFLENYFSVFSNLNNSNVIGALKIRVNSFNNLYLYGMKALEKENCSKISNREEESNLIKIKNILPGKEENIIEDNISLKARHYGNLQSLEAINKMHKLKEISTNKQLYRMNEDISYPNTNKILKMEEEKINNYNYLDALNQIKEVSPQRNNEDEFKRASSSPPHKYFTQVDNKKSSKEIKPSGKEIFRTPNRKPPFPERLSEKMKSINLDDVKESEIQRIAKIMKGSNKRQNYSISYSSESDNL